VYARARKKCCEKRWEMDGETRGISGKDEERATCVSPTVFAAFLTFSRGCTFAPALIRKLLLYPPELRGRLNLRDAPRFYPALCRAEGIRRLAWTHRSMREVWE
jgi:hypothetical protein